MKKLCAMIMLLWGLVLPGIPAAADDAALPPVTDYLLARINHARTAPLAAAAEIGLNPDEVLADFPDMAEILLQGLPAFSVSPNLMASAEAHTEDMIANGFYGYVSSDGKTLQDRLLAASYPFVESGETLGMVAFSNYMDEYRAADVVYENILRDELSPERQEARNLLNPDLSDAGLSLGSGRIAVSGRRFNAYVLTVDFGATDDPGVLRRMAVQIGHLINQARSNPAAEYARWGVNPEEADVPAPAGPLAEAEALRRAAEGHAEDMVARIFYGSTNPEGLTAEDRLIQAGYEPAASGEILEWIPYETADPDAAAAVLFRKMAEAAVTDGRLFDPSVTEAGLAVRVGVQASESGPRRIYVAVVDTARPVGAEVRHILGLVYRDRDGDGRYTPGEGLPLQEVVVKGPNIPVISDDLGGIRTPVAPGFYNVVTYAGDGAFYYRSVWAKTANGWAAFELGENG